ncbi:uncharacterized protein LOC142883292 isoform X1 [Nelusetta ayraudi]|uniref:uncharacterized protein LOC142883292 isoform X1 n=1 Tax=Nelusetta ayraudi TaxID=303726 RepID=UPI003F6E4EB3
MTVDVQPLERLEVILPDMGSGTSRGKRVAPARVSEAHAILRVSARHRAQQPECRGDGRDPERSSRDDDDAAIEADADTAVADEQEQSWACVKKSPSNQKKKKVVKKKEEEKKKKSRTYGLCRSRQEDEESGAEEPRGSRDVNKRAFLQVGKQTAAPSGHLTSSSRAFLTQDAPLEAVPTPKRKPTFSKSQNSSLTPVILYDGSEEELMDTIEREFS